MIKKAYNALATSNEQRATSNEQRATSNEQRATSNEQRNACVVLLCVGITAALLICLMLIMPVLCYKMYAWGYDDKRIIVKQGVLFRKRSVLDYKRIHAINKRQNVIQRLFGIAVLTVDSGSSNTSHQAEITIIEKTPLQTSFLPN